MEVEPLAVVRNKLQLDSLKIVNYDNQLTKATFLDIIIYISIKKRLCDFLSSKKEC